MQKFITHWLFGFLGTVLFSSPVYAGGDHNHGGHHHDHQGHGHAEHDEEPTKGAHGGRMLIQGDFALELTIFEDGVPPQFRVYPYHDQEPVDPSKVAVSIVLTRFRGEKNTFTLQPSGAFLTSPEIVSEPHSFDVTVSAQFEGQEFHWDFASHEGRTELSEAALKVAQLGIETAGAQEISSVARVYGRLYPIQEKVAHLRPRFSGVVKEVRKNLGDRVAKGDVLAVIESNQSLQPYEVRSLIEGEVLVRHATAGEFVSDEQEIFVVADLSEISADFQVYRDESGPVKAGQPVTIDLGDATHVKATVSYVSPVTDEATQSKLVRAILPNPERKLRPGLFVTGVLLSPQGSVNVAVERDAVKTFRDWNVVYLTDGHAFQAMPVELGRHDGRWVEVLSGIKPGDRYVARNSFVIKADIEKAGASHDH